MRRIAEYMGKETDIKDPAPASLPVKILTAVFGPLSRENLKSWFLIIALILLIRWVWFEPFRIPSPSMEPTLHGTHSWLTDDRVAVNKFIYGLRFPLNRSHIPFTHILIHYADRRLFTWHKPKRWEIVVFRSVEQNNPSRILIKRVVGLPGERVHITKDGHVSINGKIVTPPESLRSILHYTQSFKPSREEIDQYLLLLAEHKSVPSALNPNHAGVRDFESHVVAAFRVLDGRKIHTLDPETRRRLLASFTDTDREIVRECLEVPYSYGVRPEAKYSVVPPGHYFMLGDNSAQSRDGRVFGWVPEEHIMGRAFCIWWPVSRWRDFTGFSKTWWGRGFLWGLPGLFVVYEAGLLLSGWFQTKKVG